MPLATTENDVLPPGATEALAGGVEITAPFCTVSVKLCVAGVPTPLLAWMVKMKGEPVLLVGVPLITPVVEFNEAHGGNVPAVTLNVGAGEPVAVTVKVPAELTENDAALALVIDGASWTVRVAGVAEETAEPTPLLTVARNLSPLIASVALVTVKVPVATPL